MYDFTVEFKIKDYDRFGSNDTLGSAMIPLSKLLEAASTATAVEFPVTPPSGRDTTTTAGWMTLQCRRPTVEELEQHSTTTKKKWSLATPTQILKEKSQQMKTKTQQTLHQIKDKTTTAMGNNTSNNSPKRNKKLSPVFLKEGDVEPSTALVKETTKAPKKERPPTTAFSRNTPNDQTAANSSDNTGPLRIEIVGCQNLLSADKTGKSDPYVKVKYQGKDIHETMHIVQE